MHDRLLTLAAAVWVLALGGMAVMTSQQPLGHDTLFPAVFGGREALMQWDLDAVHRSFIATEYYPPLALIYGTLLSFITGLSREMVRLGGVLLHVLLLFQVRSVVLSLTSCRTSALAGMWLTATCPLIAGWYRLDFPEPITGVMVLATLQAALRTDLRRTRDAALLGLAVGLGSLSKLTFDLFMLAPAIYFLATTVRSWRQAANALVAVGVTLLACGWWYITNFNDILINYRMSTSAQWELMGRLQVYFLDVPWNILWTAAALAAAVLVLWRRTVAPRAVGLLLTCLGSGYALLGVFDAQERYAIPLQPVTCVLAALGVAALLRRRGPAAHRRTLLALVAGLAILPGGLNLVRGNDDPEATRLRMGLLHFEDQDFSGFRRADAWIRARTPQYVTVYKDRGATAFMGEQEISVMRLGQLKPISNMSLLLEAPPAARRYVLEVGRPQRRPNHSPPYRTMARKLVGQWFRRQVRVREKVFRDQSPFTFTVYRVPNPSMTGVPKTWSETDDRQEVIRVNKAEAEERRTKKNRP